MFKCHYDQILDVFFYIFVHEVFPKDLSKFQSIMNIICNALTKPLN